MRRSLNTIIQDVEAITLMSMGALNIGGFMFKSCRETSSQISEQMGELGSVTLRYVIPTIASLYLGSLVYKGVKAIDKFYLSKQENLLES